MDVRQLREKIQGFRLDDGPLGNQGYERVLLQLFGGIGHGKSSFINSCKYVLTDGEDFTEYADARETDNALTFVREAYPLTDTITMVDNRNFCIFKDFHKAEVYAQLGNFIKIGKPVDRRDNLKSMMEELEDSEEEPNYTDFIVPIFIYSVKVHLAEQEMKDISTFMENCVKMTGIMPIVVLTNKTSADYLEIDGKFRRMGAEMVIAIDNYTIERPMKTQEKSNDILMVIDCALNNVRYRMEQPRNPRRERIERKKFLLNYIHCAEKNKEKEQWIQEEAERQREKEKRGFCIFL